MLRHASRDARRVPEHAPPNYARDALVFAVSVAHAPRAGEGDRHRRPGRRTRRFRTPGGPNGPWPGPFVRGTPHLCRVGSPPHLDPFSTRRRHGNQWTPPMSYSPPRRSPNCSGWTRRRSLGGRTPGVSDSSAPPAATADSVDRRSPRCWPTAATRHADQPALCVSQMNLWDDRLLSRGARASEDQQEAARG